MDKIFADGLRFTGWAEPMPKFIKGRLSIKVPDFIIFLNKHQNNGGYVNISIKESSKGNLYCELDTFQPKKQEEKPKEVEKEKIIDPLDNRDLTPDDSIPF